MEPSSLCLLICLENSTRALVGKGIDMACNQSQSSIFLFKFQRTNGTMELISIQYFEPITEQMTSCTGLRHLKSSPQTPSNSNPFGLVTPYCISHLIFDNEVCFGAQFTAPSAAWPVSPAIALADGFQHADEPFFFKARTLGDVATKSYCIGQFDSTTLPTSSANAIQTYRYQPQLHSWALHPTGLPQCAMDTCLHSFLQDKKLKLGSTLLTKLRKFLFMRLLVQN